MWREGVGGHWLHPTRVLPDYPHACDHSHVTPCPTRYVLLHHVMGELQGLRNVWAYVQGGMGGVSRAIARAAESLGATLVTEAVS